MEWDEKDTDMLLAFKKSVASDDIKVKEKIKEVLLNNRFIMHVLNNPDLEDADAEPDDYYGVNILPYFIIRPTQTDVKNFICYEVSYNEQNRWNPARKILQIIFYILCEQSNAIDEDTGIARHDLLAALIQHDFNYTNYFGEKIVLVSDVPSVSDKDYPTRTLTFEQETDNNLVKLSKFEEDGKTVFKNRLANKDVVY